MVKSPQMMSMNKQIFVFIFYIQTGLFQTKSLASFGAFGH